MPTPRIAIRMDPELLAAIDAKAGTGGRTAFITDAILTRLGTDAPSSPGINERARRTPKAPRATVEPAEVEPRFKR